MQREGIGSSIGLKIIPGQRHTRHRSEGTAQTAEQRLTTPLDSVEINHHRPGALPTPIGVRCILLRDWRKPVRVFLEVLAWVVALSLDGFREPRIHLKQRRKPLIKTGSKLRMVLTQMTGSALRSPLRIPRG